MSYRLFLLSLALGIGFVVAVLASVGILFGYDFGGALESAWWIAGVVLPMSIATFATNIDVRAAVQVSGGISNPTSTGFLLVVTGLLLIDYSDDGLPGYFLIAGVLVLCVSAIKALREPG